MSRLRPEPAALSSGRNIARFYAALSLPQSLVAEIPPRPVGILPDFPVPFAGDGAFRDEGRLPL